MTNSYNIIATTPMDTLIQSFLPKPSHFDIARILYKIGCDTYSCKMYRPNIWINKTDSTIPCETVKENLVNDIQNTVKNILIEYSSKLPITSKEHKNISKIIEKLTDNNYYINSVVKEATEMFYNN